MGKSFFQIAGISLELLFSNSDFQICGTEKAFVLPKLNAPADLSLEVGMVAQNTLLSRVQNAEKIFDSGGLYEVYVENDFKTIAVYNRADGTQQPYTLVRYSWRSKRGELLMAKGCYGNDLAPDPFAYPLSELLWIQLLSECEGFILHAFALEKNQRVQCFSGVSGAGKSTMARQYQRLEPKTHLLSDDRVAIRRVGGEWLAYGTPWCGDANIVSTGMGKVDTISFIRHAVDGKEHRAVLKPQAALEHLLVRSFPAFYDAPAMKRMLDLSWDLCREIPFFDFAWVPHE